MKRIAIFASGNGSNFEAIAETFRRRDDGIEVALCVCDVPGAGVVARASRLDIPVVEVSPRDFPSKRNYEEYLAERLEEVKPDLICLAGYMRLIGPVLLDKYGGKIINIHPSLLPAFKGAHAIRDAFEYGVKVYGVTVHYVDETLDGGKIISQVAVPYEGDDIEELEALIHKAEHFIYPETIYKVLNKTEI